jgi:hypothetical protein
MRTRRVLALTANKAFGEPAHMSHIKVAFAALVVAQAAHSIEEYLGRLWESFPPARFLTGLISTDHELGFIVINSGLVAFGFWCAVWPVREEWRSAASLVWCWIVLETINGVGHLFWSLLQGGYTPGVLTAPVLLALALYLASQMRNRARTVSRRLV